VRYCKERSVRVTGTARTRQLILLVALSGLFLIATFVSPIAASQRGCESTEDSASRPTRAGGRTVELPIDLKAVRELQRAFEDGHQPWRGDPTLVAAAAVSETFGKGAAVEPASALAKSLIVECETASDSVVAGKDTSMEYRVYLKRLVAPQKGKAGIWTAIRVGANPVN